MATQSEENALTMVRTLDEIAGQNSQQQVQQVPHGQQQVQEAPEDVMEEIQPDQQQGTRGRGRRGRGRGNPGRGAGGRGTQAFTGGRGAMRGAMRGTARGAMRGAPHLQSGGRGLYQHRRTNLRDPGYPSARLELRRAFPDDALCTHNGHHRHTAPHLNWTCDHQLWRHLPMDAPGPSWRQLPASQPAPPPMQTVQQGTYFNGNVAINVNDTSAFSGLRRIGQ